MDASAQDRMVPLNDAPVNPGGEFVLYWMIAFRRGRWNFALERAAAWARELGKPLLVLEALRCDYPWASERFHGFLLDGMRDNRAYFQKTPAFYYPFVERFRGEGKGLLKALATASCLVVTDDYPAFFLPRMLAAAAKQSPVRLEAVDSNTIFPMRASGRVFTTAFSFRRFLQKNLPGQLERFPEEDPLSDLPLPSLGALPPAIAGRWPAALLGASGDVFGTLPVDHAVKTVEARGGAGEAKARLRRFLRHDLHRYHTDRNHPDKGATSGLSPYLHSGHISAHEIFSELAQVERWSPDRLSASPGGHREGWWDMSPGAEAFLDQLITWRELGFNMCANNRSYDDFDSLPEWAKNELEAHAEDPRPYSYSLDEFASAATHDPVWNAAQRQLLREGIIHNYPRMLWGKKILAWSASPAEALRIMIELNNRYALDGRDPNSYTGIFWVLGRYDRPFGPSRPVFGKIRSMSSAGAPRKIKMADYLNRFGKG